MHLSSSPPKRLGPCLTFSSLRTSLVNKFHIVRCSEVSITLIKYMLKSIGAFVFVRCRVGGHFWEGPLWEAPL